MSRATFRFHEGLERFLARERRNQAFSYSCARAATLKNAVEALGVPHTEVGAVSVNGEPATLQRIVFAENETNYCARCQTGGRILADRALSRLLKKSWPRTLEELE